MKKSTKRTVAAKRAPSAGTPHNRTTVAENIRAAIMDGRLPANTKLGEEELCRVFLVSRNVVREALANLNMLGYVTLIPNRGAYVAQPTAEEVSDVFSARRIIEAGIFSEFARNCTARDIRTLRDHLALQHEANKRNDHYGMLRLLGEFHLLIARLNGNVILADILERLVSRTGLMTVLYQESHGQCALDEHAKLIDLLAAGKSEEAADYVQNHLSGNRSKLVPKTTNARVDVGKALKAKILKSA
jgi:DNA-binding GntR family transcriptional regulator